MNRTQDLIGFAFFSFFTVCMFLISGCFDNHPIDKLIKDADLAGAAEFNLYDIQIQDGKTVNGGILVQGKVNVPFNISWEAVRPTALAALKQLKEQNPDSKWFLLWLNPEGQKGKELGVNVARLEYANQKITINYSLLSKAEMIKLVERIQRGEDIPDIPAFLSKKQFDAAVMISTVYNKFYKNHRDNLKAYSQTATLLQTDFEQTEKIRSQAINYYTFGQEYEVID